MQTTTVKLSELKFGHEFPGASLNARTTDRDEGLSALIASIKTDGLLQSLLVCPAPNGHGGFYVSAGNRRLAALRKCAKDMDVPVLVRNDVTPGSALALSLAENITQVPLHPVEPCYFAGAPKGHVLKAIAEGVSAEQSKKLASGTKAAAWKFALANVPKNWLPPELRTANYDGPGAKAAKKKQIGTKKRKPRD